MTADDNEDEVDLFRQVMARDGVQKKRYNRSQRAVAASTAGLLSPIRPAVPILPLTTAALDETDDDGDTRFIRNDASKHMFTQLRRGRIPIEESIDLHGMYSRQAEQALDHFITECQSFNMRAVLIVHGKGQHSTGRKSVLKPVTEHWLKQQPGVLAFCSALPADGGSGAAYVLLRQN